MLPVCSGTLSGVVTENVYEQACVAACEGHCATVPSDPVQVQVVLVTFPGVPVRQVPELEPHTAVAVCTVAEQSASLPPFCPSVVDDASSICSAATRRIRFSRYAEPAPCRTSETSAYR